MNQRNTFISGMVVIIFLIISCSKFEPEAPDDDNILDGPVSGLTHEQNRQFLAGDVAFNNEIFTPATGLGPIFVATSCGSCHAGDGKGTPFTTLVRFGQTDSTGNQFLHLGGPQLQNRAILGYQPELMPTGATFSKFTPPANTGLGLVEAVSDADILSMADPNDANGDGISGVPSYNFLPSFIIPSGNAIPQNGKYIHRFGKKAAAYNLLHQTVNAYNQDMGITSTFTPHDVYSGHTIDPEVSDKTVRDVVFYLQTLKAPIQRDIGNPTNVQGKNLFIQINCSGCHTPQLQTGFSPIAALSNKTIYPYTDMLLHDMGTELDDGYTEGFAKTSEWRTPPLWGLGLSPNSQGGQYFLMHDGRAKSIEEAIMMHGGEAKLSKDKFNLLNESEKSAIIQFLKSL
ncbi:MAG: c-type cytochrome [Saprospiraceae bacterium]|nr:c-type cytochrome [Saprospiraceae bacterium]